MGKKHKIFIIHGAYGNPDENWFPWLKEELLDLGCEVITPKFLTPEGQTLAKWMTVMKPYLHEIDEDTILIGHSIGATFLLSVLEKIDTKVNSVFLVAGFVGPLGNPKFDPINKTFAKKEFDWEKIRKNCKNIFVYGSDNDPYVPLNKINELGHNLGVQPIIIHDAGHFNKRAGYERFDDLLKRVKKELI